MNTKPFKFKQFTVEQNKCAMKIGTDGVLLGAWAEIKNEFSILDIGTGSGVIALMLAQRSNAELIDALEIDENAYEQALTNFENSPWSDRLFCYHAGLNEFAEEIDDKYELIISNPPFYTDTYHSTDSQRNKARFTDALPFEHLLSGVNKLLDENGSFQVIIPFKEESYFIELAKKEGLHPTKICRVRGSEKTDIKRSLLAFEFHKNSNPPIIESITIEIERHHYTDAYKKLVKGFYLKM